METLIPIIIQAISGAAGGGIVSNILKQAGAALLPKLIAGALGGIGGGQILGGALGGILGGDPAGGMDIGNILGQVVSGAGGGGVLAAIAGALLKGR
jgi:hypothetical protein